MIASDAASNDQFGTSVSVSGDTIVVGSFLDNNAGGTDAGSAYVFVGSGGVWVEQQKLTALDPGAFDQFGASVSVSEDTALVGARFDDNAGGTDAGSAYVFVRSVGVWTQQQKLIAANAPGAFDQFGFSVSISGANAVVGAAFFEFGPSTNQGTVYAYVRSGALWTYRWRQDGSGLDDQFGYSVAVSEDMAVIGANLDNHAGGIDTGSASIIVCTPLGACCDEGIGICDENETQADCEDSGGRYGGDNSTCSTIDPPCGPCSEEQILTASDAAPNAYFGYSVWLGGDTVMVGATNLIGTSTNSDAVYVFGRSAGVWTEEQKLTASDAGLVDGFGNAVSVTGDTAVVGARWDDNATLDAGAAYVFVRTGGVWTEQAKLTASDAGIGHRFGESVSVSGDTVVVGAYLSGDAGVSPPGAAYVFVRNGGVWTEQQKLIATDSGGDDQFGRSVSVSGDTAMIGAPHVDGANTNSGAVYVFVRSEGVWTQQQKLIGLGPAGSCAPFEFGSSISLSGDSVLVAGCEGFVLVRSAGVWNQQQRLTCSDEGGFDFCRGPVSLSGDSAVIGASSSAYVFARFGGVWGQRQKLTASTGWSSFGASVAISGDTVLVGAGNSAFVFQCTAPCSPPDCGDHGTCDDGTCVCDAGYAGAACDQCAPDHYNYPTCTFCLATTTCSANGTCDGLGGCACNAGFAGTTCDQCAADYYGFPTCTFCVAGATCSGRGTCNALGGCDCDAGWLGPHCISTVCGEDVECDDGDACTQDVCMPESCENPSRAHGDVNNDGGVDIFDILCLSDGFAGVLNPPCTLTNLDLAPCAGDGQIDLFDILAVLDGFAGVNGCGCPAGP